MFVCLYVDDLIFTGNNEHMFAKFKKSMMEEFDMTDLGRMRYFLGIEVMQTTKGIFIGQKKYASEILERFQMVDCNLVQNPIVPGVKLVKNLSENKVDATFYKHIVCSLIYLTNTRPDLMYVVSLISRYLSHQQSHIFKQKRECFVMLKGQLILVCFTRREKQGS